MGMKRYLQAGLKGVPFGGSGGGGGYGTDWLYGISNLPGTKFDYRREAGDLWKNSVVMSILKFQCRVYPEARQVMLQPGEEDSKWQTLYKHRALDLLNHPNDYYPKAILEAAIYLSLDVDGNAYLLKERGDFGNVTGLRYLPHFQVTPYYPKDGSEWLSGYLYRVNGKTYPIAKEDIVHLRDGLDPEDPRKGLGGLGAVLRQICTDNELATYSATLMRNLGVPGVLISPKQAMTRALTPNEQEDFKAKYEWKFRGDHRFEPMMHNIPVDIQTPGFSPEQLSVDKMGRLPIASICSIFGIDPMVLGLPSEQKTYSNYQEARAGAFVSNVVPTLRNIDEQMTLQLRPDVLHWGEDQILGRDYSGVKELQEDQDKLHDRWRKHWVAGGVTRLIFKERIGEKGDPAEDDVYYEEVKLQITEQAADSSAQRQETAAVSAHGRQMEMQTAQNDAKKTGANSDK